jgi:hypothetical protein
MKIHYLAPIALALILPGIAACSQESEPVEAAPDGIPGVEISNARLVLPAVKGNPGALYFDIVNAGDEFVAMRAVSVTGSGEAMMHQTIDEGGTTRMAALPTLTLNKGEPVNFEPGGKHVMVMDIEETLTAGDTTEATITFAGGDKQSFPVAIEAAGGGD